MATDDAPGIQEADFVLRLYELRRETVMRKSRDTISFGFWPMTYDDVLAIQDFSHPDNAAWRQVSSYWEMVYGFGQRGIIDGDFLVETNGEGILFYMKVRSFLPQLREVAPMACLAIEWAATQTEAGRQRVAYFESRFGDKLAPMP